MRTASLLLLTISVGAASSAQAQGSLHGMIGAGAATAPRYVGAEDYRTRPFPFIQLEYRERIVAGVLPSGLGFGIGAKIHSGETMGLQVGIAQSNRRRQRDGDALAGMGDRPSTATAGAGLQLRRGWLAAMANVAVGLDGDAGSVADVSLGASRQFGPRWVGSASTGAIVADGRNMRYEFGVTDGQAARRQALIDGGDTRLRAGDGAAYTPEAGLKQVQSSLSLAWAMTERTRVLMFAQSATLSDEAARSSVVRDRTSVSSGMAMVYAF